MSDERCCDDWPGCWHDWVQAEVDREEQSIRDEAQSQDGTAYAFRWPYGWTVCSTDREDIVTHFYESHEAASAEEALALFAADTRMQA